MASRSLLRSPRFWTLLAGTLALSAAAVRAQARAAERRHPPRGRLLQVGGLRVHVTEYSGSAQQTLVLLHGNGVTGEDFDVSGLVALAAPRWRVLVVDRPGFGHSERPRGACGPEQQADLVDAALRELGVGQAVVLGHSFGALVALALALRHPRRVRSLVLASGYWRPSAAVAPWLAALPAVPGLGTLWRHTVGPFVARAAWWPAAKRMFAPAPLTAAFVERTPVSMLVRPSQLRAAAQDSAAMFGAARRIDRQLRQLQVPAVVVAGDGDLLASPQWHSLWLQRHLPGSRLHLVRGAGHMVHHSAPQEVMNAVEQAEALLPAPARELIGDPRQALSHGIATPGIRAPQL